MVDRTHCSFLFAASPYNVSISATHVTYKVDAKIVVTCNAKGKPNPEYSWELPSEVNVEFSNSNKTVTITSAKELHNGTYRCLIHNIYGKNSAQIDIVFEGKMNVFIFRFAHFSFFYLYPHLIFSIKRLTCKLIDGGDNGCFCVCVCVIIQKRSRRNITTEVGDSNLTNSVVSSVKE